MSERPRPRRAPSLRARRSAEAVLIAAAVFAERGYAGVTMDDLAAALRWSRSWLYQEHGSVLDVLVAAAEATLLAPRPPLWTSGYLARGAIAAELLERHRADHALEQVVRGVADSGVPRARAVVATLDLMRLEEARVLAARLNREDERAHLVERILRPDSYAHLVVRCGWPEADYRRWLSGQLYAAGRWACRDQLPS